MTITPLLAHGGGLLPLMAAGYLAFGLLTAGVALVAAGKKQSHAMVGFWLCLASILVAILSLRFFDTLIHLFGLT
jgi:hypothetical protein